MQLPQVGPGVDTARLAAPLAGLAEHLYPGEQLLALLRARLLRPSVTRVAVSNARLLALDEFTQLGPQRSMRLAGAQVRLSNRRSGAVALRAWWQATATMLSFGVVEAADVPLLRATLARIDSGEATLPLPDAAPSVWSRSELVRAGRHRCWPGTTFVGPRPTDMTVRTILRHCRPGEYPWLVLVCAGSLVAWSDRLAIVKPGLARGHSPDRLSYGPATVVDYASVTDLEYLAEDDSGVLVVHSPRFAPYGIGGVRSPDPRTAPNAMLLDRGPYLRAQPQLDRLHSLVATARRHAG